MGTWPNILGSLYRAWRSLYRRRFFYFQRWFFILFIPGRKILKSSIHCLWKRITSSVLCSLFFALALFFLVSKFVLETSEWQQSFALKHLVHNFRLSLDSTFSSSLSISLAWSWPYYADTRWTRLYDSTGQRWFPPESTRVWCRQVRCSHTLYFHSNSLEFNVCLLELMKFCLQQLRMPLKTTRSTTKPEIKWRVIAHHGWNKRIT